MFKTVVLGDIHGRTCWKDIIERENPNRVIFLGDYVSSHERVSGESQIKNLKDILDFKESEDLNRQCSGNLFGIEVILLRGNHDVQHLTRDTYTCCYDSKVGNWINLPENRERFMKNTKWVFQDEAGTVFVHAGITECWYNNNKFESIEDINNCNQLIKFEFTANRFDDTYGESETQPCTWIRPWSLMKYGLKNTTFVVGHTNLKPGLVELSNFLSDTITYDSGVKIWCCDTLPKQYLVIEDNNFIVKNY